MNQPVQYHLGKFPPVNLDLSKFIHLIGPAHAAIARYDATLSVIPNANVLLAPLTTREAVLSSRIEGTQATLMEVMEYEADRDSIYLSNERKEDIFEIINYREALWHAVDLLEKLPICQRVVLETHKVLLQGIRGDSKSHYTRSLFLHKRIF